MIISLLWGFFNANKFFIARWNLENQKQPAEVFCKKRCSSKFRKIHRKNSQEIHRSQAFNFIEKETLTQVLSFFTEHLLATASTKYFWK